MIFDSNGLPKTIGETDYMDSARLVGILALFNHPIEVSAGNLNRYVTEGICVRYPDVDPYNPASNNPKNVTRDQILCLAAGIWSWKWYNKARDIYNATSKRSTFGIKRAQNIEADVVGSVKPWYNGADLMLPSDMGHLRRCANLEATALQSLWLICEIIFHNIFTPMREPNQILCKAVVAGSFYTKLLKLNSKLNASIRHYWADDGTTSPRGEYELAEFIITSLENM